jgi:class 3 adenylate cyclase
MNAWSKLLPRLIPLLPADLFERLRVSPYPADLSTETKRAFADDLQQAIHTLSSLHHTLTNFLPRYLLDLSPTPGLSHGRLLKGSFIFADVTGFTALTGQLSRRGTEGLEEMNRLMRALFSALLDPLLDSGGDLLMFAGDAVLAYFHTQPDQPENQDARWAARTALRMVEAIADFCHIQTPYGDFSLTMSAGVERGQAFAAAIGTRKRMEFLVSGGPVQGAMRAEGEAQPGQVFVGPAVRPSLSPEEFIMQGGVVQGIRGGELDDYEAVPPARRRSRMSAILSRNIPDLLEHLEQTLDQVERLVPFIPPDLFVQLARGEDIRQHPPVAIQFFNIVGLEDIAFGPAGPEQATAVLQRYFVQAQEIVTDREGIISKFDPYAQGCLLLNAFGAPVHHEGAPRLAASAALELARALERVNQEFALDPPLFQRTGLTYDRIFTGEMGYRQRREYVVAGPAVNLAARLMSKADPNQIVLDTATWQAVQADFLADPLPPIPLKGFSKPIPRFALQGIRRGKGLHLADYPLSGRQEELTALQERLEMASAGQGGTLTLVGEAGLGKSRLAAALADYASQQGMAVLSGRCRPFARTTPYLPWTDLVERWFELHDAASAEERHPRLRERLAQFDLASSLPAFADLLGQSPDPDQPQKPSRTWADAAKPKRSIFAVAQQQTTTSDQGWGLLAQRAAQAEADQKDERPSLWTTLRDRASIPQALKMALERQVSQRPTLLIIEDIQWIDDESRQVLEMVSAAAKEQPLFLLLTARPPLSLPPNGGDEGGERLSLSPLSDAGSRKLAAFALQATQLEPALADWLLAQVGGSPLFILSYCQALRDADAVVVDPVSGEARWSGSPPRRGIGPNGATPPLPLSLQETLLAQVDRLAQATQKAIRRGAVIGTTFSTWLLTRVCQDTLLPDQLNEALEQAARRGLITPPPHAQTHAFTSHSLHEAIYATLSHAQRRAWHEQVGDLLAEADEPTRYERVEQIAYHYSHSDNASQAARFTRLAGDKARARQANGAALKYYNQTVALADGDAVAVEQRLAHEGIGDIYAPRGEGEAARAAYQAALEGNLLGNKELHPELVEGKRRLRVKLALLAPLIGPVDSSLFEQAWQTLPPSDPLLPWLGAAWVWLHAGRGEVETATTLCRSLLSTAKDPLDALLRDTLESLEKGPSPVGAYAPAGKPLCTYADFFSLFAYYYLRLPPRSES